MSVVGSNTQIADAPPETPGQGVFVRAAVALGSNLGDRSASLEHAGRALTGLPGTTLLASATPIETDPVGPVPQGRYLNTAAIVRTSLAPRELLAALLGIERAMGRDRAREQRWGPRVIDLDIILYGDRVIDEPDLTVPHPRMHERLFVLEPLCEIAADLRHPLLGRTVDQLLHDLRESESDRPASSQRESPRP